jgi:hypothetical protein
VTETEVYGPRQTKVNEDYRLCLEALEDWDDEAEEALHRLWVGAEITARKLDLFFEKEWK